MTAATPEIDPALIALASGCRDLSRATNAFASACAEGNYQNVREAKDRMFTLIGSLVRERDYFRQRSLENQMLAFSWSRAHDMLAANEPYEYPKPADLHDSIALAEKAENERDEAATWIRVVGDEMVMAGFPGGDRNVTLANLRNLVRERDNALRFSGAVLKEAREHLADVDGGSIQDWATKHGLLECVRVSEPCGEECRCAEYGEFPHDCYRYSTLGARAVEMSKKAADE